jgi:hypothetical protein
MRGALRLTVDEVVKSQNLGWWRRKFKIKARKSRGLRPTYGTPQRLRDAAQRRNWTFYAAIKK